MYRLCLSKADEQGYKIFDDYRKPYNLNIFGWRHSYYYIDKFHDDLIVFWPVDSKKWEYRIWPITTLPGLPWLFNPINEDGTAVLVPGQYRNCYYRGMYKGDMVLRQMGKVRVFRDNNRDGNIDTKLEAIQEGNFGIHIHAAGWWSKVVGVSSAGCQVFQRQSDFKEFMQLTKLAADNWGNSFTYTLMEI